MCWSPFVVKKEQAVAPPSKAEAGLKPNSDTVWAKIMAEDAMSVGTQNSSIQDGEEEMKDKSIEQLKEEQLSVQRQLMALKGPEDK
eukprot:4042799-Karenia_brevis.AAC.1